MENYSKFNKRESIEKIKQVKIIVCGPPNSGKSIFISSLKTLLPSYDSYFFRACPDGEGTWTQKSDTQILNSMRKKHTFDEQKIQWYIDSIKRIVSKIVMIDIGGIRSEENKKIFQNATHFIVLCRKDKQEEKREWEKFGLDSKLKLIASFDTSLEEPNEIFVDDNGVLRGTISNLKRGELIKQDIIKKISDKISDLVDMQENTTTIENIDGIDKINLNNLSKYIDTNNIVWDNNNLKYLCDIIKQQKLQKNIWIDGNCPVFVYLAVLDTLMYNKKIKDIYITDFKIAEGKKKINKLQIRKIPNDLLYWKIEEREDYTFVHIDIPNGIFDMQQLDKIILPKINSKKGLVLSGKLPLLMYATIFKSYINKVKWISIFTPQQKDDAKISTPALIVNGKNKYNYINTPVINNSSDEIKDIINPNINKIDEIATKYIEILSKQLPDCEIVLGGSIASKTLLKNNNDVDIKILIDDSEKNIDAKMQHISNTIKHIVPFQKYKEISKDKKIIIHQKVINIDNVKVNIEVQITSKKGYVGYAKLQRFLPQEILNMYMKQKFLLSEKYGTKSEQYKQFKQQFISYTKTLYKKGLLFKYGYIKNDEFRKITKKYFNLDLN